MFRFLHTVIVMLLLALTPAAANTSTQQHKFSTYIGPEVTTILVQKAKRKMYLMHGRRVLREYTIYLGFNPVGHKRFEGDGRTPEGTYRIDRKNPNSEFYLSLGISYPNNADRESARRAGRSPGGDIFIHGWSRVAMARRDWTLGCIAVRDHEMREIYAMVKTGTIIHIMP